MFIRTMNKEETEAIISKVDGYVPKAKTELNPKYRKLCLLVDTETTGVNPDDRITEIALALFEYDKKTNTLHNCIDTYVSYNDPHKPIPEKITKLTGITDEMVAGKLMDYEIINKFFDIADVVVAHNAYFDRTMVESYKEITSSTESIWACSMSQIDWKADGYFNTKLEQITAQNGEIYKSHNALSDVYATANILGHMQLSSGISYFEVMMRDLRKAQCMVLAKNAPFKIKDDLKDFGFQWDMASKVWKFRCPVETCDDVLTFLNSLYDASVAEVNVIDRIDRFSKRSV